MRRGWLMVVVGLGLAGQAHALPGVKTPKVPIEAEMPSLPSMSVAEVVAALDDADRKLTRSADKLFSAQMSLLEALGRADLALEYQAKLEKLRADAAAEERDADVVSLATDAAIIEAMIAALEDKKNEVDDERKAAARKANVQIVVARLMAVATGEDAATISAATIDLNARLAKGDKDVTNELANQSDPPAYVAGLGSRAGGIKNSTKSMIGQSQQVSKVMDKYRKKKKLFEPISADEAKTLFAESGF